MVIIRKTSPLTENKIKIILIILVVLIASNLNFNHNHVSRANLGNYSQSNVLGDINLTITINSQNLQWDDNLNLNITVMNTTSLELLPNSQISLNISSFVEIHLIIPMSQTYNLAYESINASNGFAFRSILIQHVPTLNPYVFSVDYLNNSISILNVSFHIYIESRRSGFIEFFTFEHFILLYFGLLAFCGIYLGYLKYRKKSEVG